MTLEARQVVIRDLAYLAACAVNETVPSVSRVENMDLEALYQVAKRHMMTGIAAMALESAGINDAAFSQAKGKAIRKVAAFDIERTAILQAMEEAGIWYAPLKGCVLSSLYPRTGMRQMSDNDILFDDSRTMDVKTIMESRGFTADAEIGAGVHDHYVKPPVYCFEMHRMLFGPMHDERIASYYRDIKTRLILNEGSRYGYHFSDDDFYLYMIAHEFKHYSGAGIGLRSLLDTYVFLKSRGERLDWTYLQGELDLLGIADFEAQNRSLACHLFGGDALTEKDQEMLDYVMSSGVYGTMEHQVENRVTAYGSGFRGKLRYLVKRLFLPMETVRQAFPLFAKWPILLPFLPLYRLGRALLKRRGRIWAELKTLVTLPGRRGA